jgi:hypothetical protein
MKNKLKKDMKLKKVLRYLLLTIMLVCMTILVELRALTRHKWNEI